jgi:superfamily I DNA/RNA helicase
MPFIMSQNQNQNLPNEMVKFADISEIEYAHSVLLNGKPAFEADKIAIIESNESRDVKACPGSGKTTTLLAKLIILANRMPLPDNQGICVLTHTNVAINEIKEKLGHKADVLFRYPNHFGTIQSFVDKYLSIPMYRQMYGKTVRRIDNDAAFSRIATILKSKDRSCLYYQIKDRISGSNRFSLEFDIVKDAYVKFDELNSCVFFLKYNDRKAFAQNPETVRWQLLHSVRLPIIESGVLTFQDAYSFALRYCEKHPHIKNAFSERFNYLFIDEMQDTEPKQIAVLERLFDPAKTIIQKFGDHHQAIYNSIDSSQCWTPSNYLPIDTSKRFGENIAKVLRTVCIENNANLVANPNVTSLDPIIIVFDDPQKVLPKYCELLKTKTLGDQTLFEAARMDASNRIKAVGWVGKPNATLSLKSYFENYNQNVKRKEKVSFDSLKSFLVKNDSASAKDYSDKILEALLHILYLADVKIDKNGRERHFTKALLSDYYSNNHPEKLLELKVHLADWSIRLHNSSFICEKTYVEIAKFIREDFCAVFAIDCNSDSVKRFLDNQNILYIAPQSVESRNIYTEDDLSVEISTIHSAKGETHFSTLYLETSYYDKCESQRIMSHLIGTFVEPTEDRIKKTLKMAYVGMSRPQYLLCMAIHKDRYDNRLDRNNGGNWEICTC